MMHWLKTEFSLAKMTCQDIYNNEVYIISWKGFALLRVECDESVIMVYEYSNVMRGDPHHRIHDPQLFENIRPSVIKRIERIKTMSL